jgi:hypothetical protein
MSLESSNRVTDGVLELVEGAIERELIAVRELTHGNRLQVGHPCLEQATLVVTAFAAIRIAHVNLDARDAIAEAIQEIADRICQALLDICAETYVIVVIDLDLHADLVRLTTRPKLRGASPANLG